MERNLRDSAKLRRAWLRLILGLLQMFGAVFSAVLLAETGVNRWSLGSVIGTGVITAISIILFGTKPFGILRKHESKQSDV